VIAMTKTLTALLALLTLAGCSATIGPSQTVPVAIVLQDRLSGAPIAATLYPRLASTGAPLAALDARSGHATLDAPVDAIVWVHIEAPGYAGGDEPIRTAAPLSVLWRLTPN
jgi:hypothetical protein